MITLEEAKSPAYLKIGCFGGTGTGKTYTMAKVLSQFIAEFIPGSQLAMFDTEGGGGYIKEMVKKITGKPLLSHVSQSFSELIEFADLCRENGYVALLDSATHPWRNLCKDYLESKKTRVAGAGGNQHTTKLSLKDWGPIKDMWNVFADKVRYDPVHWCINGREGDVWEDVTNDEGESELRNTGKKMKTETELGYEPSLLVRMTTTETGHRAFVMKERFDVLTYKHCDNPDIAFFRPHLELLSIGGKVACPNPNPPKTFESGRGPSYETLQAQREAVLENIQDDIMLLHPGQSAEEKKNKINLLRKIFGTSSWTALEKDQKNFPVDVLLGGREILLKMVGEKNNG